MIKKVKYAEFCFCTLKTKEEKALDMSFFCLLRGLPCIFSRKYLPY